MSGRSAQGVRITRAPRSGCGTRKLLVADVGGVVLVDGMRELLSMLSTDIGRSVEDIQGVYRASGLRDRLWMGSISTASFWEALGALLGTNLGHPDDLDARMVTLCKPLASARLLSEAHVEVWLASNHRAEWLRPALANSGLRVPDHRVVCSSEVGECKPSAAFFELVADCACIDRSTTVHFLDDQAPNLVIPAERGWMTSLVDGDPVSSVRAALATLSG